MVPCPENSPELRVIGSYWDIISGYLPKINSLPSHPAMPSTLHGNPTEGHRWWGSTGLGNPGEAKILSVGQPDHRSGSGCENQVGFLWPWRAGTECPSVTARPGLEDSIFNHNPKWPQIQQVHIPTEKHWCLCSLFKVCPMLPWRFHTDFDFEWPRKFGKIKSNHTTAPVWVFMQHMIDSLAWQFIKASIQQSPLQGQSAKCTDF